MFYRGYVILLIANLLSAVHTDHEPPKQCTNLSSIQSKDGKFKIVAFVPVNNEYPDAMIHDGILRSEVLRFVVNDFNAKCGHEVIGYTVFDTCSSNEFDVTTEGLLKILIDDDGTRYHVLQNNSTLTNPRQCRCVASNKELSNVIGLISALSSKTAHINKLLSYHRLPLISFSSTSPALADSEAYPYLYRTIVPDTFQARFLRKFLLKLNWTYISVINSDDTYGRAGAEELTLNSMICTIVKKSLPIPANDTTLRPIMENIRKHTKSNVIVLWGHFDLVKTVLQAAVSYGVEKKTWIISEAAGRDKWFLYNKTKLKGNVLIVVPNGGHYEKFQNYFFNLTLKKSNHSIWLKTFFNRHGGNLNSETKLKAFKGYFSLKNAGFVYSAVTTYLRAFLHYVNETSHCDLLRDKALCTPQPIRDHKEFSNRYIKPIRFPDLFGEVFHFNKDGDAESGAFELYLARKDINQFQLIANWSSSREYVSLSNSFWNFDVSREKSKCSDDCAPGFKNIPSGQKELKQCCWKCVRCPEGTIKEHVGLGECTECPDEYSNNENNTECFPLLDAFIDHDDVRGLTIYIVSIIGVLSTFFVMTVFVIQRSSRIVRSADIIPSLIQLFIHFLISILPYLFFDEDTHKKCIVRTFGVGLLFTLIISITLSKVSHVSNLFTLRHRMNDRERMQMRTKQILIISIPVLLQIFFVIILFVVEPISVELLSRDVSMFKIHKNCDVNLHLTGQLVFLTVLQAVCCIKAFLARKLPDIYNETKYILFAMFTSLLVMLLSVPLIASYQTPQDKNFVLAVVIMIANLLILLILYSYKMYLIFYGMLVRRPIPSMATTPTTRTHNKRSRHISTITLDSVF